VQTGFCQDLNSEPTLQSELPVMMPSMGTLSRCAGSSGFGQHDTMHTVNESLQAGTTQLDAIKHECTART